MLKCRDRCGKIIATIGSSTTNSAIIEELFIRGVDIFRLNFSHGTHEERVKQYEAIRSVGRRHERYPAILADLQGPKLRIGLLKDDRISLKAGDIFFFDLDNKIGDEQRVALPHPEIFKALQVGTPLLLDDGKLRFETIECSKDYAKTRVVVGGSLLSRKGVNVPQVKLDIPILTEKDRKDLSFALDLGVDWIACSFVQTVEDVVNVKSIVRGQAGIISKLEKPLAIESLEPIISVSDGVMIARGDLGVEMNPEEVPVIQRRIIRACRRIGRPVIVATHMLESMTASPVPTRAEVSDIATAVYCGADATMLSAESASGKYPFEAVSMMSKTITSVEADRYFQCKQEDETQVIPQKSVLDAACAAAKNAAEYSSAVAIVLFSDSFESVVRCSRLRPRVPIIFVTPYSKQANRAALCRGVYAVCENIFSNGNSDYSASLTINIAKDVALKYGFAHAGDTLVALNNMYDRTSIEIGQLS